MPSCSRTGSRLPDKAHEEDRTCRQPQIHRFVADAAVLYSLEFTLAVQGSRTLDGSLPDDDLSAAAAIVIDVATMLMTLQLLQELRDKGCIATAPFLVTNPNRRDRKQAQASGAVTIERPFLVTK